MHWRIAKCSRKEGEQLSEALNIAPPIARLLAQRGFDDPEVARRFLEPRDTDLHSPYLFRDMDRAVRRINQALQTGEIVAIYGDYDVDGVTAAALLGRVFGKLAGDPDKVLTKVPHRGLDGYGLNPDTIDQLHARGAKVVVSADCGISAHAAAERARELGIDFIVTDHHEPQSTLPAAYAVIDPKREDSEYPFRELAGVGVAFKLAQALAKERGIEFDQFAPRFLDLVALGTIADNAPLLDENRAIVKRGLMCLSETKKMGLRALLASSGPVQKPVRAATISYQVAPRLNAVGRVDDAARALDLMMTSDAGQVHELVDLLERLNDQRRQEQERIWQEALSSIKSDGLTQHKVIVVQGKDWHRGIIGIIAGRIADVFHRPALVIATDGEEARGSARSAANFPMIDALGECRELLTDFGGHCQAAGFDMPASNLDMLRTQINEYADGLLSEEDIRPTLDVDLELNPEEINLRTLNDMNLLEPFGTGNREPIWMARNLTVSSCSCFGKATDRSHLSLRFESDGMEPLSAVWWRKATRKEEFTRDTPVDVVFRLEHNHYGHEAVRLNIQDMKPTGSSGDSDFMGIAPEDFPAESAAVS